MHGPEGAEERLLFRPLHIVFDEQLLTGKGDARVEGIALTFVNFCAAFGFGGVGKIAERGIASRAVRQGLYFMQIPCAKGKGCRFHTVKPR